jgi:hypothetical protein
MTTPRHHHPRKPTVNHEPHNSHVLLQDRKLLSNPTKLHQLLPIPHLVKVEPSHEMAFTTRLEEARHSQVAKPHPTPHNT